MQVGAGEGGRGGGRGATRWAAARVSCEKGAGGRGVRGGRAGTWASTRQRRRSGRAGIAARPLQGEELCPTLTPTMHEHDLHAHVRVSGRMSHCHAHRDDKAHGRAFSRTAGREHLLRAATRVRRCKQQGHAACRCWQAAGRVCSGMQVLAGGRACLHVPRAACPPGHHDVDLLLVNEVGQPKLSARVALADAALRAQRAPRRVVGKSWPGDGSCHQSVQSRPARAKRAAARGPAPLGLWERQAAAAAGGQEGLQPNGLAHVRAWCTLPAPFERGNSCGGRP